MLDYALDLIKHVLISDVAQLADGGLCQTAPKQPTAHFSHWSLLYAVIDVVLKTRSDGSVQGSASVGG